MCTRFDRHPFVNRGISIKGLFLSALLMNSPLIFAQVDSPVTNKTPEEILRKFNSSKTIDDLLQCVTGVMREQIVGLKGFYISKNEQEKFLKSIEMKSYDAKSVAVNDNLQFVLVSHVARSDGHQPGIILGGSIVYKFVKVDGQWKMDQRLDAAMIMFGLLKQKFSPGQFDVRNAFEYDGQNEMMQSAFAYIENQQDGNKGITIKFYPFVLHDQDIEFLKYGSGPPVPDTDHATAIASSIMKYPQSEMTILLDKNNQLISFCQNGNYFKEGPSQYNVCIQPYDLYHQPSSQDPYIQNFSISDSTLNLTAKGSWTKVPDNKKINWNIDIHLPLIKKGIN